MHDKHFRHGIALFDSARFFDAHEALEDVWREAPRHSTLRRHLQGLVQVAVAFHHQSTRNRVGARSVLVRALRNLQGAEASFPDLELDRLRSQLAAWQEFLAKDEPGSGQAPPLPKITSSR
jgi:predicted metal-dependent hydrolase